MAIALLLAAPVLCAQAERYALTSKKAFTEVLEDLEFAIGEENFRITERAHVGAGIAERAGQPFPAASVLHFCNLQLARRLLEVDPAYIAHMPCRVSLREQGGQVIVEAWLLPEQPGQGLAVRREVNEVLRRIVAFAAR